jgi:hypothetical protein
MRADRSSAEDVGELDRGLSLQFQILSEPFLLAAAGLAG